MEEQIHQVHQKDHQHTMEIQFSVQLMLDGKHKKPFDLSQNKFNKK